MTHPFRRRTALAGMAAATAGLATAAVLPASAAAAVPAPTRAPAAGRTSGTALAFLNHTYVTLDVATAEAISASAYLKEFGLYEERTTTNGQGTYTGRYLRGRETYLEIFPEGGLAGVDGELGATGLALSPDREGGIDRVLARMVEAGVSDPLDLTQTREIDGEQVPWFRVVTPSLDYQRSFPWVMEYLPSYLDDPRTEIGPPAYPGDVSRLRYNARTEGPTYRDRLMRDVVAVELDVPAADLPNLEAVLRASGYRVRVRDAATVAVGAADAVVLRTVEPDRAGWRRITFALNGQAPRHTERMGRSRLDVVDRGAVWSFER